MRHLDQLFPRPRRSVLTGGSIEWNHCPVEFIQDPDLGTEAYRLTISNNGCVIRASCERGMFYGKQTLAQLRKLYITECPCLEIQDEPSLGTRGYMLDISRCRVPRMDHLFRLVDLLSAFKFNQLQLYMEHTFAYDGHREIWNAASPITPDEILELDQYCKDRFIELVPNQNAFGHMERWLRNPSYQHLAESPDGFMHPVSGWKPYGSVLFPGQESIEFVDGLLQQLLPCFNSNWIHLGCDEPWELGKGRSADRVETEGRHRVFRDYVKRLHELASKRDCRMLFWSDELREDYSRIGEFPPDLIPVVWGYEADHPFDEECRSYEEYGYDFLLAPGDSSWNSHSSRLDNALRNITSASEVAVRRNALGMLLTSWGDNGHQQVWPTQLPAMLAFAAQAWNQGSLQDNDLESGLSRFVFNEQDGKLASFWCSFARLDSHLPVRINSLNSSFSFDALHEPAKRVQHALKGKSPDCLYPAMSWMEHCRKFLQSAKPEADDTAVLLEESKLAYTFAMFGLRRAEFILKGKNSDISPEEYKFAVDLFRSVWLKRSREGGLDESLNRLHDSAPVD